MEFLCCAVIYGRLCFHFPVGPFYYKVSSRFCFSLHKCLTFILPLYQLNFSFIAFRQFILLFEIVNNIFHDEYFHNKFCLKHACHRHLGYVFSDLWLPTNQVADCIVRQICLIAKFLGLCYFDHIYILRVRQSLHTHVVWKFGSLVLLFVLTPAH